MVRAPCCEKMGLKKGPWTQEEDQILIAYIQRNGHGNWRALPKLAGLLRCGKSCRLRWINYLKPDIKRGNFSREEEETIIKLHELLGNRWSTIAARLPGRTDNEIKNVWHTHLKKRVRKDPATPRDVTRRHRMEIAEICNIEHHVEIDSKPSNFSTEGPAGCIPSSPQQQSSGDISSSGTDSSIVTTGECLNMPVKGVQSAEGDENAWWEAISEDKQGFFEYLEPNVVDPRLQFPALQQLDMPQNDGSMDFWFDLYMGAGEQYWPELPEL